MTFLFAARRGWACIGMAGARRVSAALVFQDPFVAAAYLAAFTSRAEFSPTSPVASGYP